MYVCMYVNIYIYIYIYINQFEINLMMCCIKQKILKTHTVILYIVTLYVLLENVTIYKFNDETFKIYFYF